MVNGVMSNNIARGIMTNGLDELSTGNIRWKITLIGAGNVPRNWSYNRRRHQPEHSPTCVPISPDNQGETLL